MTEVPCCPKCSSENTYLDVNLFTCPECAHEWSEVDRQQIENLESQVKDAHGNVLNDGDTVTVVKDLKVNGTSLVVKVGTKVKGIRLVEGDHDIDCKIKGIGAMQLKSEFVKKVT